MPICLRLANSTQERDAIFRLRYQVYVAEEGRFSPDPERRILDRFDCFPSTFCVLATDGSGADARAAATLRFAVAVEGVGLPSDSFFDFSKLARSLEGGIATIGMLAVAREFRGTPGLVLGMFKVAYRELRRRHARHVVAPASPDVEPLLYALGAKAVADTFEHGDPPVAMTPLHIDLDRLPSYFREISVDPRNLFFEELNERRLYHRGETILERGQAVDEAYLIMRGSARVLGGEEPGARTLRLMGPGELFGELSLIDNLPASATVVAHSELLDVAPIAREEFQGHLARDLDFTQRIMAMLGERMRRTYHGYPETEASAIHQRRVVARVLLEASEGATQPVDIKWLAADCGLTPEQLDGVIGPWLDAGAVARTGDSLRVDRSEELEANTGALNDG